MRRIYVLNVIVVLHLNQRTGHDFYGFIGRIICAEQVITVGYRNIECDPAAIGIWADYLQLLDLEATESNRRTQWPWQIRQINAGTARNKWNSVTVSLFDGD